MSNVVDFPKDFVWGTESAVKFAWQCKCGHKQFYITIEGVKCCQCQDEQENLEVVMMKEKD